MKPHGSVGAYLRRLHQWMRGGTSPDGKGTIEPDILARNMSEAATPSSEFFLMLSLSAAIATMGLIADSGPAIIGAMIIAPLMSPIISAAFGIASADYQLVARAFSAIIVGVVVVIAIAYAVVMSFGLLIAGHEILARSSPSLLDLGVALAAGCAGAYAQTRPSIANSIAGVAIAVALVPPLATTGVGLSLGQTATTEAGLSLGDLGLYSGGLDIAKGSFILFLTNLIGIIVVAALVFTFQRYGQWKKSIALTLAIVVLSTLLLPKLSQQLHEVYVKNRVARIQSLREYYLAGNIAESKAKIERIQVEYRDDILHVQIDLAVTENRLTDSQNSVDRFRNYLENELGEPVVLKVDITPLRLLQVTSSPANLGEPESDP